MDTRNNAVVLMERLQLKHGFAQFVIDIVFGVALFTPLVYYVLFPTSMHAIMITIGVGIGYMLHMIQKVLLYEEMLSEQVRETVEREVPEAVEKEVPEMVDKEVKEQTPVAVEKETKEQVPEAVEKEAEYVGVDIARSHK